MEVRDLEFDGENIEHLAAHNLTLRRIYQVIWGEEYLIIRNKKSGSGQIKMIGSDYGGQFWTIVLAATNEPGLWRPITGWQSTMGERTIYRNQKGR